MEQEPRLFIIATIRYHVHTPNDDVLPPVDGEKWSFWGAKTLAQGLLFLCSISLLAAGEGATILTVSWRKVEQQSLNHSLVVFFIAVTRVSSCRVELYVCASSIGS